MQSIKKYDIALFAFMQAYALDLSQPISLLNNEDN